MKKGTYIDLTGQKFNHLTAVKYLRTEKGKGAIWLFKCDCGNEIENLAGRVKHGTATSCGCMNHLGKPKDILGKRFGKWVVEEKVEKPEKGSWWKCRCDCGTIRIMTTAELNSGTRSCGCSRYKKIDEMIGKCYGKWTVLERDKERGGRVICHCDCGTIRSVSASALRKGTSKSCGCKTDLVGQRFGRLLVLKEDDLIINPNGSRTRTWFCQCDCGTKKTIRHSELISGHTTSCGCYHKELFGAINKTHGLSAENPRLYKVWKLMRRRCNNPKDKSYSRYGGIGIKVCDEWNNSFVPFYEWSMANGYKEDIAESGRNKLSIDRIDNDGDYEPSNCRWTTDDVQARNKGHHLDENGKVIRKNNDIKL